MQITEFVQRKGEILLKVVELLSNGGATLQDTGATVLAQQRSGVGACPEGGCSSTVPGAPLYGWSRKRGCPHLWKVRTGWGAAARLKCRWADAEAWGKVNDLTGGPTELRLKPQLHPLVAAKDPAQLSGKRQSWGLWTLGSLSSLGHQVCCYKEILGVSGVPVLLWELETKGDSWCILNPVSLGKGLDQMDPMSLFLKLLSIGFCLFEDPGLLGRDRIHQCRARVSLSVYQQTWWGQL